MRKSRAIPSREQPRHPLQTLPHSRATAGLRSGGGGGGGGLAGAAPWRRPLGRGGRASVACARAAPVAFSVVGQPLGPARWGCVPVLPPPASRPCRDPVLAAPPVLPCCACGGTVAAAQRLPRAQGANLSPPPTASGCVLLAAAVPVRCPIRLAAAPRPAALSVPPQLCGPLRCCCACYRRRGRPHGRHPTREPGRRRGRRRPLRWPFNTASVPFPSPSFAAPGGEGERLRQGGRGLAPTRRPGPWASPVVFSLLLCPSPSPPSTGRGHGPSPWRRRQRRADARLCWHPPRRWRWWRRRSRGWRRRWRRWRRVGAPVCRHPPATGGGAPRHPRGRWWRWQRRLRQRWRRQRPSAAGAPNAAAAADGGDAVGGGATAVAHLATSKGGVGGRGGGVADGSRGGA